MALPDPLGVMGGSPAPFRGASDILGGGGSPSPAPSGGLPLGIGGGAPAQSGSPIPLPTVAPQPRVDGINNVMGNGMQHSGGPPMRHMGPGRPVHGGTYVPPAFSGGGMGKKVGPF